MSSFTPPVPWNRLIVEVVGGLHGVALLATVPWLFWRGFPAGGVIALMGGVGVLLVFGKSFRRTWRYCRTREAVGQARRERYQQFERELSVLPEEERGPHLADEIEAILGGKR